ncbi:NAD(P)/FAD-dependent oxidoreductase [Azospirillum sp. B4]|uniref:NAD(P)/FAD-dependent oxidoreductase n=1 Tax=Azospirillum sp. B4 TaxID=95605 RepID=UPI0003488151|nr:FAD-dependent oxidoreductase [Azospirillum sp. B4]
MVIDILIAGAGQAAAQLALSLRQRGHTGTIAMIGEEPYPPYERPPLSKDYLSGQRETHRLFLRKPEAWAERRIDLHLGCRVAAVSPAARRVTLADGRQLDYGWLVWATGGRPRALSCPGADLAGVHAIRGIADIDRLKGDLTAPKRIVVIGGGYIGLEAAAVLRGLGHTVTVVEMQDRLLARVTSPVVSQYFLDLHRRHGVDVRLSTGVRALRGAGRVTGAELSDGTTVPADIVIVGIGIIPNVEPLAAAGLSCPNGVQVDAHCRTDDPHILAIGDCALHPNPYAGGLVRVESVQNAVDQAKVAAETILGTPKAYDAMPWFWSDQYDLKLQTAGLCAGHGQVVVRGDPSRAPFTAAYLRGGRLVGLDCVGTLKDFVQGKALVTRQAVVDPARLADPAVELKTLA